MTYQPTRIAHRALPALVAVSAAIALAAPTTAQAQDTRPRIESRTIEPLRIELDGLPERLASLFPDSKRPVIGVSVSTGHGAADTLGLLIASVDKGGPAEKAGIKEGDRITAVNGVSLHLSAADAADPETQGLASRRLIREVGKAKPGDDVELRVLGGGQARTVHVKPVAAAELSNLTQPTRVVSVARGDLGNRASLGLSIGGSSTTRDTLGLFVFSVNEGGPAEKGGVIEGYRIAAINGVDVRVPKEDAADPSSSLARMNRFTRELEKAAPGDKVTLRVYGEGRYRDVQVTAAKASELRGAGALTNFFDGNSRIVMPGGTMVLPRMQGGVVRTPGGAVIRRGNGQL